MPRLATPQGYQVGPVPLLPDTGVYRDAELAKIEESIATILPLVPQVATAAPKMPQDGMVRLARSPWRPLSGQQNDQWVYFDGSSNSWKAFP